MIAGLLSLIGNEEREMGFHSLLRERYPECRGGGLRKARDGRVGEGTRPRGPYRQFWTLTTSAAFWPGFRCSWSAGGARSGRRCFHPTPDRRDLLRQGLIDALNGQIPEFAVRGAIETTAQA